MTRVWREHDVDTTFRRAHRFIDGNETEAIGAFPVLKFKSDNSLDLIFVKEAAGRMTSFSDIHQNDSAMIFLHERFQGSDIYDGNKAYVTAFPVHEFHNSTAAAILLNPESVETKLIHWNELGLPRLINHWGDMLTAFSIVDHYAVANNFAGGFLDCHLKDEHRRLFLFKKDYFERKSVPEWRLNHLTNFRYNFSDPSFEARIRKAHNVICSILARNSCAVLTESDTTKLKEMYYSEMLVHNADSSDPTAYAFAYPGCKGIWFNVDLIDSLSDIAFTQTTFHELMHNLGYHHPKDINDPTYNDTIPVKVETCVIGYEDETQRIPNLCKIIDGPYEHCPT
ncbi:hypothetical protein [Brevibacillus sp. BC25]|uniref:hypothetical protein n=1 Tax=Brevibacillus sp. BC25 TaxID=1144308 RepID=UPI0002713056|nr:hypothetical protein [Brevibacillus sp. BC25]EJL29981.1 hypothetical protein PMI05_01597 [Brevibacillus sp. BC25]